MNEKHIQQVLDIEKQAQAIYEAAVEETKAIPVQAEQEAQVILEKARAEAEKEASQMVEKAQSDADSRRILAEMEEKIRRAEVLARGNHKRAVADVLYRVVGEGVAQMGGVSDYAATNARVRSMVSTLLTEQDYRRLAEADDFETLLTHLQRTVYGKYLDRVKDREMTPRRAVFALNSRLAEAYTSIISSAPIKTRDLLLQLYRDFEVDNLKAVLRGIVAGSPWDTVRFLLFPLGSLTVLPAQEMLESGSVAAAIELLRGTPYEETLTHAMRRYSAEQTLFPLEVALDLNYWRSLWAAASQLTGQDRTQAMRVIGPLLDMTNLMWAIRYRVFHRLSEEELINYTLPFGYHVRDEDIRSIAAGADISRVVERLFPHLHNTGELVSGSGRGLSELEVLLHRDVIRQVRAVLLGNPFHVGVPLAYLILQEMEIQDVTILIEAKSSRSPAEGFTPYLLMQSELA